MKNNNKTREQLLKELEKSNKRIAELEKSETEYKQAEEEKKKYKIMVESARDVIFFKDLESRYLIANKETLKAFGLPPEKVIGKNDLELMPDEAEARKNIEDDRKVFRTGESTEITKHMKNADGDEFWFNAIKVPHFDKDGNIAGLIGIARDITERKQADKAFRESEERYRSLVTNLPVGIFRSTPQGNVLSANPAMADIYGYDSVEELFKVPAQDYYAINKTREKMLTELEKQGFLLEYETLEKKKDGSLIFVSTNYRAVWNNKGEIDYIDGVVLDITMRKKVEEEIVKHREHLEKLVKERTADLEEKNTELKRYNKLFEGREIRIKELKDKVKELEEEIRKGELSRKM